jgi:hypothetical protein
MKRVRSILSSLCATSCVLRTWCRLASLVKRCVEYHPLWVRRPSTFDMVVCRCAQPCRQRVPALMKTRLYSPIVSCAQIQLAVHLATMSLVMVMGMYAKYVCYVLVRRWRWCAQARRQPVQALVMTRLYVYSPIMPKSPCILRRCPSSWPWVCTPSTSIMRWFAGGAGAPRLGDSQYKPS